jgi:hypothetical protein
MSSEDLFFQKVREAALDYAPEVPASVYSGMRRKYNRSRFWAWSASSLNVWYVAALGIITSIVFFASQPSEVAASQAVRTPIQGVSIQKSMASEESFETPSEATSDAPSSCRSKLDHTILTTSPINTPNSLVEEEGQVTTTLASEEIIQPAETTEKMEEENTQSTPVKEVKKKKVLKATVFKDK